MFDARKRNRGKFEVLIQSFLSIQPRRIFRGYSLVMSPREQSESTKVVLVLQHHQGAPLHLLTTETTTCFQGRQIMSMKLRLEMLIQVTFRRSLLQRGPMTTTNENLPGNRPAREDRHGRAKVMFQRGTRICRKGLRCQCRRLKNLNPTLFRRSHLMVNNVISIHELC